MRYQPQKENNMKYYIIFGYYDSWEVVDFFEDYAEATRCLKEYRMDGGCYSMQSRFVKKGKDPMNCKHRNY